MLNTAISIYVPSTLGRKRIDNRAFAEKITRELAQLFGGATSYKASGAWVDAAGTLISEPVTIVKAFCEKKDLTRKRALIFALARELKAELKQDAVSIEIDNVLEFV